MQTTDKAEQRRQKDDFQGLIIIKKSQRGRRLKQPITVEIPENLSQGEKAVRQYVIDAFCWKMSELIHFTFRNETVLKLATRLINSTNGSEATLYQYTYGVYAFFRCTSKPTTTLLIYTPPNTLTAYRRLIQNKTFTSRLATKH